MISDILVLVTRIVIIRAHIGVPFGVHMGPNYRPLKGPFLYLHSVVTKAPSKGPLLHAV